MEQAEILQEVARRGLLPALQGKRSIGFPLLLKEVRARELWPAYQARLKFNPHHVPAGSPEGGRFTSAPDTGGAGSGAAPASSPYKRGRTVRTPSGDLAFSTSTVAKEEIKKIIGGGIVENVQVFPLDKNCLRAAVQVADQLRIMKAEGYDMPKFVAVQPTDRSYLHATVTSSRESTYTKLIVNVPSNIPDFASLGDAAKAAFENAPKGLWSARGFVATSFKDLIVHEMAHVQDAAQIPVRLDTTLFNTNRNTGDIAAVSGYAVTNMNEFVAEAFTAMYKGETLPERTMKIYNEVRGPKVRRP